MSESAEVRRLLDALVEITRVIESHEAVLWQLKHEQHRLRSELAQTGYRTTPQGELL